MEIVDSMAKVEEMLALYEHELVLELTVMKRQSATCACLNQVAVEAQKMINIPVLMSVDPIGVTHICDDEEAVYSVPLDFYDVLYLGTQQSSNFSNEKTKEVGHVVLEEEALDQDDLYNSGEVESSQQHCYARGGEEKEEAV
jgi:hypothetical protein